MMWGGTVGVGEVGIPLVQLISPDSVILSCDLVGKGVAEWKWVMWG